MPNPKLFLIFDTETIGLPPKNAIYDIAWQLQDRKGNIYEKDNFLVEEIMTNPELMNGAYFKKKTFSHYIPELDASRIRLRPFADIANRFRKVANSAHVVCAYNLAFDRNAMRATCSQLGHNRILDNPIDILDIWYFACMHIGTGLYHDAARKNGWVSEAGNVRTTAETVYRFLFGDWNFVEHHTAAEDCSIEGNILTNLLSRKKTIPYNQLHPMPWKLAQMH